MIIYTDRPLDRWMEILPPLVEDPLVHNTDSAPIEYRSRLKYGIMEFVDWTSVMKKRLRDSEPLMGNWWAYLPLSDNKISYEDMISPYFNPKCIFSVYDLIFIYWYLANVGDTIVAEFGECIGLIPEIPISKIDISNKIIGKMPMDNYRRGGIRYIFTDSKKTTRDYDTKILKNMELHEKTESTLWRSISNDASLKDLIELCGNIISKIILFEQNDVSANGAKIPDAVPPYGEIPLPKTVLPIYSKNQKEGAKCQHSYENNEFLKKYADCKVKSYMIYSRDSMSRFAYYGVEDEIGLAVVIENTDE